MPKTEDDKIMSLIEEYRRVIDTIDMDISHSDKGKWYATRYNEQTHHYDFFIEFHTAEQLREILTGESVTYMRKMVRENMDLLVFRREV